MFSRLNTFTQRRRPEREALLALLPPCEPMQIQLQNLHKGIDNAHIDITLCPLFMLRATQLVRNMLRHDFAPGKVQTRAEPGAREEMDAFLKAYAEMMEVAILEAQQAASPDRIQLLQLGAIKFILGLVNDELERLRDEMQRSRGGVVGRSDRRALEQHERMVALAKAKGALRNAALRRIFTQLIKQEKRSLRVMRKSVLGLSWPLPRAVFCNPMLWQPLPWEEGQRVEPYLALWTETFDRLNRLLSEILHPYLPDWALAGNGAGTRSGGGARLKERARLRQPQSGIDGSLEAETLLRRSLQPEEYLQGRFCWLDAPRNIELLSSPAALQDLLARTPQGARQSPADWRGFQRYLRKRICQQLRRSGLALQILAAHEAQAVARELSPPAAALAQPYLSGEMSRKTLQQRLAALPEEDALSRVLIARRLDHARDRVRKVSRGEQESLLLAGVTNFLRFRRDLKNAFLTYQAMDQLAILSRPEDIELSSANGKLYRFVAAHEPAPRRQRVCRHVIIKADIRGSTLITSRLLAKGLNPATYFSLNLFKPISRLLERYGATKVFVEGDAIILSILEHENTMRLSVAWACGLAQRILEVVDVQNTKNEQYGLPPLELGLGIAFSQESPTFLYDDEKQIMISSAINRADQLSSCSATLRRGFSRRRGVEVMTSTDLGLFEKEHPDRLLRFNVDGIELDWPAFDKLRQELALKSLSPDASLDCDALALYVGRYPDSKGVKHWLVIRKAAVHYWADSCIGPEEKKGRCFYEVLTDPDVLAWARSQVVRQRKRAAREDTAVH